MGLHVILTVGTSVRTGVEQEPGTLSRQSVKYSYSMLSPASISLLIHQRFQMSLLRGLSRSSSTECFKKSHSPSYIMRGKSLNGRGPTRSPSSWKWCGVKVNFACVCQNLIAIGSLQESEFCNPPLSRI